MEKFNFFNKAVAFRVAVCFLCFILAFMFVMRPPAVSASSAVATTTVIFGGSAVSVPWGVAVVVVVLIALGCTGTLEDIVDLAYGRLSTSITLTEWTGYMSHIAEGTVIPVPTNVQEELEQMAKEMGLDHISISPSLRYPSTLYDLDNITASDVFVSSNTQAVTSSQLTTLFTSIQTSLTNLSTSITNGLGDVKAKVIEWGSAINYNTGQISIQIKDWLSQVNANVVKFGADTVSWTKTINSNLTHYFNKLEAKLDSLLGAGTITISPTFSQTITDTNTPQNQAQQNTDNGKQQAFYYFGESKDIIKHYGTAFLAVSSVLGSLFSVPIFHDLLAFSLALGIFALIVNLANSVPKGDGRIVRVKKEG